jgi:hypothetical protein
VTCYLERSLPDTTRSVVVKGLQQTAELVDGKVLVANALERSKQLRVQIRTCVGPVAHMPIEIPVEFIYVNK